MRAPPHRRRRASRVAWLLAAALVSGAGTAGAETTLAVYLGRAIAADGSLRLTHPDGTDLTLHDASWRTESFRAPIHYGIRASHWFAGSPEAGVALDFTHAKIFLNDTPVRVTGADAGTPLDRVAPPSDHVAVFGNSHGLNLLTVNVLLRGDPPPDGGPGPREGTRPYGGLGVGVAIPHVEAGFKGESSGRYQFAGPTAQVFGGARHSLDGRWSLFAEYKLNKAGCART